MARSSKTRPKAGYLSPKGKWSGGDPLTNGIHPIRNRNDHKMALRIVDDLMDSRGRTRESAYLEAIGVLIHHYESKRLNRSKTKPLVRPYSETIWKRFWRDPEFALALAHEAVKLARGKSRKRK